MPNTFYNSTWITASNTTGGWDFPTDGNTMYYTDPYNNSTWVIDQDISGTIATGNTSIIYTDGYLTQINNKRKNARRVPHYKRGSKERRDNTRLELPAKIYFKFLKNSLKRSEQSVIKERMSKVARMVNSTLATGQKVLFENLGIKLVELTKESEIIACGFDRYLSKKYIDKMWMVKEFKDNNIKQCTLKEFPRVIPAKQRKDMELALKKNLFDEIKIIYLDYTREELKTNERKIRDKDPIAFGIINEIPDRYYYICDWVDEYCDLTLNKLVDNFRTDDPEFALEVIPEIEESYLKKLFRGVFENKRKRLSNTNSSKYKNDMKIDEKETLKLMKKAKRNPVIMRKLKNLLKYN